MPPTLSKIEHQLSMRLRLAPLFFAYFVFASLAAAENLLPNGDFEEVNGSLVTGWIPPSYAAPNAAPYASAEGGFPRGKTSLYLKSALMAPVAGGKATSIITKQKIVGLVTDVEYCLTFWARSSVANQPLRAYFYADDNVKPHWYKKKDFTVTANWEKYVFLQKIPPDEEWNRRALYIRFDIPYGEVFLDEAALEPNTSKRE